MTENAHPYRGYWYAWLILLALTLAMVFVGHPAVLLGGMMVKATIIALWFMHLRHERLSLGLAVAISILFTGLALFVLIAPDGRAM